MYDAPKRRYHYDAISGLQENLVISKMVHDRNKITIEH